MTPREVVLRIVRGEMPVSALRAVGLSVRSVPQFVVRPAAADLAAGILRYATRTRGRQRWAELLLHADFIDILPEHDHPGWDSLMGAIWDAAGGAPISISAVEAAREAIDSTAERRASPPFSAPV